MRAFGRIVTIAATLIAFAGMARAADIRVLGVAAVEVAIRAAAADFQKETGHQVIFTIGSLAVVMQKIKANEIHDAVIVSEPAMDQLDKDGLVNPETRVRLAKGEAETGPFAEGDGAKSPGPVPPPLQLTTYEGALMSDGSVPQEARAFIRFLASADARDKWVAAKLEPFPDH
jgi:ABC-type molybdate transport system substrate-binding protein